jgi:purine-binding chemotaxis protein CheW
MEYQQEQLEPIPPEQPERGDVEELPSRQYCIFRAGRERFCVPVMDVEEVVEWPSVTRVPLAPSFLMGVFNLRGSIVPIVDIAFTEGRHPDLPPRHVVVGLLPPEEGRDAMRIGIAADQVIGTYVTADALMIEEAPRDVPHCCGMLRHEDKLALALDVRRVAEVFPVPVI